MKTIRRKLDEIGGDELNNMQKNQLQGGSVNPENCYYCVCFNSTGTWVTKASSSSDAESEADEYCASGTAHCGEVEMWQCWGIA